MESIRNWALTICLTLIITGTAYKFLPEKSGKNLVRFMITLMCLTAVFRIDIGDFKGLELNEIYSASYSSGKTDKKIEEYIGQSLNKEISVAVLKILSRYDKNGAVIAKAENGEITLEIKASLNEREKLNFEKEAKEKLETDIRFIYAEN